MHHEDFDWSGLRCLQCRARDIFVRVLKLKLTWAFRKLEFAQATAAGVVMEDGK